GEWMIKDRTVRIPEHSELIIVVDKTSDEDWELAFGRSELSSNHMAVKFAKNRIQHTDEVLRKIKELNLERKYRLKVVQADGSPWSLQKVRHKPHWEPPDFWE